MRCLSNPIVRDPRIPSNLAGLRSIAVDCDASQVALTGFSANRIRKEAKKAIEEEGLEIDRKSKSKLLICVATESSGSGAPTLYAVEVALRESVALPRDNEIAAVGTVDTWRHQTVTGIATAKADPQALAMALTSEALRQVEVFLNDWSSETEASSPGDAILIGSEPLPDPPTPKLVAIKKELEKLLTPLAIGNAGKATIDRFDILGTVVDYHATIIHREKNPAAPLLGKYLYAATTPVEGRFDTTNPASVIGQLARIKLPRFLGGEERAVLPDVLAPLF